MSKTIKNLIYVFVVLVMMPTGRAVAEPRETQNVEISNVVMVAKVSEPEVRIEKVVEMPKELPQAEKPKVEVTKNMNVSYNPADYPSFTKEEIKVKICQVFGSECQNALIIALKESGYTQFAVSKTNDYGIFQLNCRWQKRRVGGDCRRFFDVDTNIRVAKQIFDEQGWNPWTTKKYLP